MKAFEIFQKISPETTRSVFQFLRDEQREVYVASLSSLASNRKLRPVFIQRKPAAEQIEWLAKNVKLRGSAEIADQVMQLWLMKAHQDVLVQFLDGIGIEHDGEGAAEDLPEELNAKKVKSTIDKLLKEHNPEVVKIYLNVFQLQRSNGWDVISEIIATTPALQFGVEEAQKPELAEERKDEAPAAEEEE
ncbi:MAG: hypothetical protein CMO61_03415 [Verrucomicrobiales bacterium]|jgi:hypothetical protein|nr:hypothetical protein [Verrucomicrobiales bacterium]|tara:strand:- start:3451 stop:4020 length:570 start_codon:yes stop_codon:yes gene_type:complete